MVVLSRRLLAFGWAVVRHIWALLGAVLGSIMLSIPGWVDPLLSKTHATELNAWLTISPHSYRDLAAAFLMLGVLYASFLAWCEERDEIERLKDDQGIAEIRRKAIREQLGAFISEGQAIMTQCACEQEPAPTYRANNWATRVEEFLPVLGPAYVARFRSAAGLPIAACAIQSNTHRDLWSGIYSRLARLELFSQEVNRFPNVTAPREK